MSEYTDYLQDVFMLLGPIAARRRFGVPGITPRKLPILLDACLAGHAFRAVTRILDGPGVQRTPPSATSRRIDRVA
ncbi:hypothetical protein PRZ61_13400 [Halomonas pacifica]|uniref:hypothetical protein n=1 Tax=Bisbaumannia pacifica TaxID=77098 RepID=UPI002358375C|nr:hypothetical protein [Halomonas pacifica]MDC8804442.1 hypothetical protein [Halomonas pacifica]